MHCQAERLMGSVMQARTLSGRVLAPRSRSGSLNLRLLPSTLILRVTRVSGLVGEVDAMTTVSREESRLERRSALEYSVARHGQAVT